MRYFEASKPGTIVELPDGERGTVVYNGLDGIGIKWGEHKVTIEQIKGNGGCFDEKPLESYEWFPDAMLRENYPNAELPCVGEDFKIISTP